MKKIFGLFGLFFVLTPFLMKANAAVTPNSGIAIQTPKRGVLQFLQGTDVAGTYKTCYTAGANGSKINGIYATTTDASVSHATTCQLVNNSIFYGGVDVNVPTSSGMAVGIPAVNLMSSANWPGLSIDAAGNPYFILSSGDTLQCTFATAMTTNSVLNIVAIGGGDF